MALSQRDQDPPRSTGVPPEMGELLAVERKRQGLTHLEVTLATRLPEQQIRMCETGHRPAWSALQPYVDFLSKKAGKAWRAKVNKALDGAIAERLHELTPAGQLAMKAYMLKACRDSSVGRAAALPSAWDQLKLPLSSSTTVLPLRR